MNIKLLRWCLVLIIVRCSIPLYGQGEWNNWYFGVKAGVTFQNGSPPTVLMNSSVIAPHVSNVISDSSGQLLFYTQGLELYNRLHQIMQNGYLLHGGEVLENVVSVPLPGSRTLFYIFTNGWIKPPPYTGYTFEYNIVDMTLDNGNGGVLPGYKNVLVPGTELSDGGITAVVHQNKRDYWIIVPVSETTKRFHSYLLTKGGLQPPVISLMPMLNTWLGGKAIYRIRASQDGKRIVALTFDNDEELAYFSFNPTTGVVSSLFTFKIPGNYDPHSAEFSVSNRYLYVFAQKGGTNDHGIWRFDTSKTDSTEFVKSREKVVSTNYYGKMQLGPDNKIYLSKRTSFSISIDSISVIKYPDLPVDQCGYQDNYVGLLGRSSADCLPSFIRRYFAYIHHSGFCQGASICFEPNTWPPPDSLWWDFGDPSSGVANFSNDSTPEHNYNAPGIYTVKMIVRHVDMRYDTATLNLTIEPQPMPNLGPDRMVCQDQPVILNAGFNPQWTYLWGTGETTPTITVTNSGTYSVTVTSPNGCTGSDEVVLSIIPGSTPEPKPIKHN
ncbi:MAG TPA: PKD domain-containing protein [Bacteroidales bacterium]|nr:PKD domain-containing protein [Bacteroidales bacterium]